jgi:hypothetical protein
MGCILGGTNAYGKAYYDNEVGGVLRSTYDWRVEGLVRVDEVDRTVLCLKSSAASIAADLATVPDPLVIYVGKDGSVDHGSGWGIAEAGASSFSPTLQQFNIKYQREVPALWDWMRPASVTISCSGTSPPTTVISFDGTPMISYETPGYACDTWPLRYRGRWLSETLYRIDLYCNGWPVESWEVPFPSAAVDPMHVLSHRLHWVYSGVAYARLKVGTTTILDFTA